MGGIFGVLCSETINGNIVVNGLKRLIYRGYDGAGIAYHGEDGRIYVKKSPGHIDVVDKEIGLSQISSDLMLGHVRYASRGWPSYENTHPLVDCSNRIAVVGDGVIEDYEESRRMLEKKGHKFSSRTDTEVYAHLLEDLVYKEKVDPLIALANIARSLRGFYAIAAILEKIKRIYALAMGQPIVVGLRNDRRCVYVSSDIPSLYGFADEAIILEENMAAAIDINTVKVLDIHTLKEVNELRRKRVKYPVEVIGKAGFPHYMLKEIYEIPEAIIKTTYSLMDKYLRLSSMIIYGARNVYIIANGSSLHAGLVSSYYFADLAGINVNVVSAAEFPYYALENVSIGTVVIAISQSGETSDVIKSIRLAKQRGAVIIGITNVVGSRLTLESNTYLPIGAGPEIAVPATKTFVSTITAMAILAGYTGLYTGTLSNNDYMDLLRRLREHAKSLYEEIRVYDKLANEISSQFIGKSSMYVVSSGINYPIALEAALKFKEAALIHAEGIQLGELRHGPIVLIQKDYPLIFIKPIEETAIELYERVVREVMNRSSIVVTVTQDGEGHGVLIRVKSTDRILSPITSIIPLQLLAYHIGVKQGLPVDTPPGLAKAITT